MKNRKYVKGDRYFFDKRVIKAALIKYGIMFVIALPILIVINVYLINDLSFWAATFVDVGVLLLVVLICLVIYSYIKKAKGKKLKEREEKEREMIRAQRKLKKKEKKKTNKAEDKE